MKARTKVTLSLFLAITLVLGLVAAEPNNKPTEKDKDGYILFYLSLQNAGNIQSESIKITGTDGNRTLQYKDHILSCGTWMNGQLNETTQNGIVSIKGNWKVTKNPFEISNLEVNLTHPENAYGWAGTIVVDGKTCIVANSRVTQVK